MNRTFAHVTAALTNPSESSFRSHLTELSFRRHLAGAEPPAPIREITECAPFRFANHVAISLRTPTLLYKTLWLFSFAFTSPLGPPAFLSDPPPKKGTVPRDRIVVWVGYLGHWTPVGMVPRKVEWAWRLVMNQRQKKKDRPGVMELRAVNDGVLPKIRKSDSISNLAELPLHAPPLPVAPFTPDSRRPSIAIAPSPPPVDETSPLLTSLKTDLSAAQAVLAELSSQLVAHEQSVSDAHAGLQTSLEELRTRRKEDDAERQDLKSRTKSLEEQKRQAEGARREAEKKLRAAEGVRDGLQAKIDAAMGEVGEIKGNMESAAKGIRALQEDGARHIVETQEAVEEKQRELESLQGEIDALETRNEELVQQVAHAEEQLKTSAEAVRLRPEEEMMMMAAAYEAAAQEGYLYGQQQTQATQWASQAAAYMAEAGMPYLDQSYTARSTQPPRAKRPDVSGFEDFGPGAAHEPTSAPAPAPPRPVTPTESEAEIYGNEPGSPGGISSSFSANLLPQGLFRSLEGDATPLDADRPTLESNPAHDSGSDSDEDHWRSPMTSSRRLLPPSTTPPGGPPPNPLAGLPAIASRPWYSGTTSTSAENLGTFSFLHPTMSNDSLNLPLGYEASPFAPSASEKKALALKWGPLSKYRWAGARPASVDAAGPSGSARSSSVDLSSTTAGSSWLASRLNGTPNGAAAEDDDESKERKQPFRFFSIRKPKEAAGANAGAAAGAAAVWNE
jgi:predicted  nucleic acid-binding Zn-ribbon protein